MKHLKIYEEFSYEITWEECVELAGYKLKKHIGSGSMGDVYSLKDDPTKVLKITNSRITANTAKYIMDNIVHPNVNKIYDVKNILSDNYKISDNRTNWYPQDVNLYIIVMEKLVKKGKYNEEIINNTLEYLEDNGISNEDFFKDNVMYRDKEPVIIDIMDGNLLSQNIEKIVI